MRREPPRVTVILPSRDRPALAATVVSDVTGQPDVAEVVVVDQSAVPYGSIEGARVVRDDGLGPCRARNAGARAARGDVLCFLDDDGRVGPDLVEELCGPILRGAADATCGAITGPDGVLRPATRGFGRRGTGSWLMALTNNPDSPRARPTLSFPAGCCAIRREVYEAVGGFDPAFDPDGAAEDRDMALRLWDHGTVVHYRPGALFRHVEAAEGGRRSEQGHALRPLERHRHLVVIRHFGPDVAAVHAREWALEVLVTEVRRRRSPVGLASGLRRAGRVRAFTRGAVAPAPPEPWG